MFNVVNRQEYQKNHTYASLTEDGSPTLIDLSEFASESGEAMHNSRGALSESVYVYGPAIEPVIDWSLDAMTSTENREFQVLVIGMGLAYLELMTLARLMAQLSLTGMSQFSNHRIPLSIASFESNKQHQERIRRWMSGIDEPLVDLVATNILNHHWISGLGQALDLEQLRAFASEMHRGKQWVFHAEMNFDVAQIEMAKSRSCYHAILFDAYSSKSSPELWNEDFLDTLLRFAPSKQGCFFATYASKGTLHRILKKNDFQITRRPGFGGKRECTFAQKSSPYRS